MAIRERLEYVEFGDYQYHEYEESEPPDPPKELTMTPIFLFPIVKPAEINAPSLQQK